MNVVTFLPFNLQIIDTKQFVNTLTPNIIFFRNSRSKYSENHYMKQHTFSSMVPLPYINPTLQY